MSWLSKAVKSVGKVFKPIEKLVRPVVKTAASIVPGGSAVLDAHRKIKSSVYDPLRRGGEDASNITEQIRGRLSTTVDAARGAVGATSQTYAASDSFRAIAGNPVVLAMLGIGGVLIYAVARKR